MIPKTKPEDMVKALRNLSNEFAHRAAEAKEDCEHWDWVIRARALSEIADEFEILQSDLNLVYEYDSNLIDALKRLYDKPQ